MYSMCPDRITELILNMFLFSVVGSVFRPVLIQITGSDRIRNTATLSESKVCAIKLALSFDSPSILQVERGGTLGRFHRPLLWHSAL